MPSAKGDGVELPNVPWGIISVKAQVRDNALADVVSECFCHFMCEFHLPTLNNLPIPMFNISLSTLLYRH